MKKLNLIIIIMIVGTLSALCQTSDYKGLDYSKIGPNKKIWTMDQVYLMTQKFGIQDTFFNKSHELKTGFKFLLYVPQPDLDNYCLHLKNECKTKNDFVNYNNEMKIGNINSIDDWINLLSKYPSVLNYFYYRKGEKIGFVDFIEKIKNRKILIYIQPNGAIFSCENTKENYYKYMHLKRLK